LPSLDYFRRLYAHDVWANREVLKALRACGSPPEKSLRWMGHIVSAEKLWFERIHGQFQMLPVWPESTLDQCEQLAAEMAERWPRYLAELTEPGLEGTFTYQTGNGQTWTTRIDDALLHVAMHATYHRGQIAADLRSAGCTPAPTDFIVAVRNHVFD
jgi:uncharacterized damage-inducible protein DinB